MLFVCMGNICRSPTAEGVFRHKANVAGLASVLSIGSAGTHADHIGKPPDLRSQEFAFKCGIDLSAQRARQVNQEDFIRFDFILAMDKRNLALLRSCCPAANSRQINHQMAFKKATHSHFTCTTKSHQKSHLRFYSQMAQC
ncbi:low molecular weight protein-tyrosine-phosphatase [Undibacterium sp. SXout7W]|uniref:low molecular weight protein-tyrosine-phosphatase n=1 Tax=Undibacterium sp. SXout7W TaxID=3413049 RepID=UPI003BF15929